VTRRPRLLIASLVLPLLVVAVLLVSTPAAAPLAPSPARVVPGAALPAAASPAPRATAPTLAHPPAVPPAARSVPRAPAGATPRPAGSGWKSGDFFQDIQVTFSETGLTNPFLTVPYTNVLPMTTLGFWVNISSSAPILFANITIWGTQWPENGVALPIQDFPYANPAKSAMLVNTSDPSLASYYFDDYRFFWPGSTVGFNISVVGNGTTPSQVESAWNESVPMTYTGGYTNLATWIFQPGGPWSSTNFTNDIQISTTPNVLGATVYAPNPDQKFTMGLRAVDLGGTVLPIPYALLQFTVSLNGSAAVYSDAFGPTNHTNMTLVTALGPYPGATVSFNVTAWLPWEDGRVDVITSPEYSFTWSSHGGWWHPLSGLTGNLALGIAPALTPVQPGSTSVPTLPTAAPVNVTIHEPIENVTIGSAQVAFTYSDQGVSRVGTIPMTAITANTSVATIPGLPPGAQVTFVITAKDIFGDPITSGNYSYTENGPTSPSLPSGRGLLYVEVLDLSVGTLVAGFPYTISNATWSESANANQLGFGVPLIPGATAPYQLAFGSYTLTVHAFGETQSATVDLSPSSPTPVVVFYAESTPLGITTTGSLPTDSIIAAIGLIGAAVATLPLMVWWDERRAKAEEEQRRVTL
jgi:hypothetical protein